jgi:roadblock/LC7 domain-containing protein
MKRLGKFTISGQTPAQKNGKSVGTTKAGRTFVASNKRVKDWQKAAIKELEMLDLKFRSDTRLQIDYMFYVKDNVQRDTDNMISSVNDILQVAGADYAPNKKGKMKPVKGTGMIVGDHWQVLKLGNSDVAIDKDNPRAELVISEL